MNSVSLIQMNGILRAETHSHCISKPKLANKVPKHFLFLSVSLNTIADGK